jgi:Spy/CpxP family protein refolding chaperone
MDEFRKKMLDYTTPEQRAKFENGIQIFNERRKERGLPPVGPGGRPF